MQENEFKEIYVELSNQCKKYSCDLLDLCRSTEEVIAVLNKKTDSSFEEDGDTDKLTLSRLKLALKYEQKQASFFFFVNIFKLLCLKHLTRLIYNIPAFLRMPNAKINKY